MDGSPFIVVMLAIIIGVLAAVVYSLRILVLLERRIGRIDLHIERMVEKIAKEEIVIENKENEILKEIKSLKKPNKKTIKRKK
ncbi:MAG: hypothetical protein ACMXX8_02280 [Candidatus Woesearchaeota archaeon]